MAEYSWSSVVAGGEITSLATLNTLMGELNFAGADIAFVLAQANKGSFVEVFSEESAFGLAEGIVEALTNAGLDWRRVSDGKYEYDGSISYYDAATKTEHEFSCLNNDDQPMLSRRELVMAAVAGQTLTQVIDGLAFGDKNPPPFTITPTILEEYYAK